MLSYFSPSLCGFVVGCVVFIGGFPVKYPAVDWVDHFFQLMHLSPGASGEVGFLGIPPANETVAVLNRAFFSRGVSPRVVDVTPDNIFYLFRIQEFTSVVGGNWTYSSKRLAWNHAFYRFNDIFLCDMVDEFDDITPALSVDKHKKPCLCLSRTRRQCPFRNVRSGFSCSRLQACRWAWVCLERSSRDEALYLWVFCSGDTGFARTWHWYHLHWKLATLKIGNIPVPRSPLSWA